MLSQSDLTALILSGLLRTKVASNLTLANEMQCANGWSPATCKNEAAELEWRVWASKGLVPPKPDNVVPATERLAAKMQEAGVTIRSYTPGTEPSAATEQVAAEMLKSAGANLLDGQHRLGCTRRANSDGTIKDCFVEAPREGEMAYGLEVLGDDYEGYGCMERKLELIVKAINVFTANASKGGAH